MRKIAIKVELASGILVQGASLILQAGLGITIFIGTVLITNGKIELLSLLVLLMFSTQIYGPILAILSQIKIEKIRQLKDEILLVPITKYRTKQKIGYNIVTELEELLEKMCKVK